MIWRIVLTLAHWIVWISSMKLYLVNKLLVLIWLVLRNVKHFLFILSVSLGHTVDLPWHLGLELIQWETILSADIPQEYKLSAQWRQSPVISAHILFSWLKKRKKVWLCMWKQLCSDALVFILDIDVLSVCARWSWIFPFFLSKVAWHSSSYFPSSCGALQAVQLFRSTVNLFWSSKDSSYLQRLPHLKTG